MSDSERWDRVQELFFEALDRPPAERAGFVTDACGPDEALAAEVRSLLAAHHAEGLLPERPEDAAPRLYGLPFDRIGPYGILRPLGQGGMGRVFLAERKTADVTQIVALKLLRVDFAVPELMQRFRNERRILARLEHPGIARLIDAGAAPTGQPFYAMEFVEGQELTEYVRERQLSLRERLELFQRICEAVAYAHQQLVVHRDLKPSNILVGEDGRPKLLDFGVAKLVEPDDGEALAATATRTGRFFTPDYASPEQVRGEPATTLSDVYALGLLLDELLTDERPFDLRGKAPSAVERIICYEVPRRPSERTNDSRLRRQLSGDLDTIVMKALAKEPGRRYATVRQLAEDVRRYLDRKPVRARPARWTYRASRFLQRHRTAAIAGGLATISLCAGLGGVIWQGAVARQERDRAEEALRQSQDVTDFLARLFQAADPNQATGDTATARAILRRGVAEVDALANQPLLQARMLDALAMVFIGLGEYSRAHEMVDRGLELRRANLEPGHPDVAASLRNLGRSLRALSRYEEAEAAYLEALAILREDPDANGRELAGTLENLGFLMPYLGRPEEATRYYREALELNRRLHGEGHPAVTNDILLVGLSLRRQGRYEEALALVREAVDRYREDPGPDAPETGTALFHLADVIIESGGDSADAEALYREGVAIRRRARGERDLGAIHGLENVAGILSARGRHDEAEELLHEALELRLDALGPDAPAVAGSEGVLADELARQGRYEEALEMKRRALATWRRAVGPEHAAVAHTLSGLAQILLEAGRYEEAERLIREEIAMRVSLHGPEHPLVGIGYASLGHALTLRGAYAEAEGALLRGLAILRRHASPEHIDLRRAHTYLAELYEATGRSDSAAAYRNLAEGGSR